LSRRTTGTAWFKPDNNIASFYLSYLRRSPGFYQGILCFSQGNAGFLDKLFAIEFRTPLRGRHE
jgi:hypothetical protein